MSYGAGKGDKPRAYKGAQYRSNYEQIFGGKTPKAVPASPPAKPENKAPK